jgi:hypothetical protein
MGDIHVNILAKTKLGGHCFMTLMIDADFYRCRHLCCKDGTEKPPKTPRKLPTGHVASSSPAKVQSRLAIVPGRKLTDHNHDKDEEFESVDLAGPDTRGKAYRGPSVMHNLDRLHTSVGRYPPIRPINKTKPAMYQSPQSVSTSPHVGVQDTRVESAYRGDSLGEEQDVFGYDNAELSDDVSTASTKRLRLEEDDLPSLEEFIQPRTPQDEAADNSRAKPVEAPQDPSRRSPCPGKEEIDPDIMALFADIVDFY